MNPFAKKLRFSAILKRATFKNVKKKGQSAQDGGSVRMVDLVLKGEITEAIGEVIQRPRKSANGEDLKDVALASTVNIYAAGDFTSKSEKAIHKLGGDAGDGCVCDVTKTYRDDDGTWFQLWIRVARTPALVSWISDMIGEGECVVEVHTTQQQLPGVEDEAAAVTVKKGKKGKGKKEEVAETSDLPLEEAGT